jgi:hypothetical protein
VGGGGGGRGGGGGGGGGEGGERKNTHTHTDVLIIITGICTVLQDIINKLNKLRSTELLEKLAISSRNSFRFVETQGSLTCAQNPATKPYLESLKSSSYNQILFHYDQF